MAVFPDRIVLKNSTDDAATIEAAIASGGTDAIVQGEMVLGLADDEATLYTVDSNGDIVTISGGGGGDAVESVNGQIGVVSLGIQDMDDYEPATLPPTGALTYSLEASNGEYIRPVDIGRWYYQNSTRQQLSFFSPDGTDLRPDHFNLWQGGHTISWTQNGVLLGSGVMSTFHIDTTQDRVYWTLSSGTISHPTPTDDVIVVNETLSGGSLPAPLVEGDILQWVDADQKFKPAQLPAQPGGGLPEPVSITALALCNFDDIAGSNDVGINNAALNSGLWANGYPYTGDKKFGTGSGSFTAGQFYSEYVQLATTSYGQLGTNPWTVAFWWKSTETGYAGNDPTVDKGLFTSAQGNLEDINIIIKAPNSTTTATDGQVVGGGGSIFLAPVQGTFMSSYGWVVGTTDTSVTDGNWHYITFQCSGADSSGDATYECFVDGVLNQAVTKTAYNFVDEATSGNNRRAIGRKAGAAGDSTYIIGTMDSFVVYDGVAYSSDGFAVPTAAHAPTLSSFQDGQVLAWSASSNSWEPGDYISKATLKTEVAASADFADFKTRIAAL